MKKLFKKNQIIITGLALMIAVAGYLNYSGRIFGADENASENDLAAKDLLDISMEDSETDIIETPGEAVLTSQRQKDLSQRPDWQRNKSEQKIKRHF